MVIYNISIQVDWKMHDDWFEWMTDVHIPEMMATLLFEKFQLARLKDVDDEIGPTYCAQFYAVDETAYRIYLEKHASYFSARNTQRWGQSVVSFSTIMEVVS